jgi:hypothetical protein
MYASRKSRISKVNSFIIKSIIISEEEALATEFSLIAKVILIINYIPWVYMS